MPIDFDLAVAIAKEFAEQLPEPIAADLEDVEILVCKDRKTAIDRLNAAFFAADPESAPITEEEIPFDTKGVFIGEPAYSAESDESEQDEVIELASGYVVLICDQIDGIENCKIVILHEFGHALGLDEEEINNLGLGMAPTPAQQQEQPSP